MQAIREYNDRTLYEIVRDLLDRYEITEDMLQSNARGTQQLTNLRMVIADFLVSHGEDTSDVARYMGRSRTVVIYYRQKLRDYVQIRDPVIEALSGEILEIENSYNGILK